MVVNRFATRVVKSDCKGKFLFAKSKELLEKNTNENT